jgi:putative endonuclease
VRDKTTNRRSFAARRNHCRKLGRRGERLAVRLLTELGLEILVCNYRARRGEIDIVARDNETLCFVEVKTRRRAGRSRPGAAVGRAKQRAIVRAARQYLREIGRPPVVYRYDVVEIILARRRPADIRYRPIAFTEKQTGNTARFPSLADWFEDTP